MKNRRLFGTALLSFVLLPAFLAGPRASADPKDDRVAAQKLEEVGQGLKKINSPGSARPCPTVAKKAVPAVLAGARAQFCADPYKAICGSASSAPSSPTRVDRKTEIQTELTQVESEGLLAAATTAQLLGYWPADRDRKSFTRADLDRIVNHTDFLAAPWAPMVKGAYLAALSTARNGRLDKAERLFKEGAPLAKRYLQAAIEKNVKDPALAAKMKEKVGRVQVLSLGDLKNIANTDPTAYKSLDQDYDGHCSTNVSGNGLRDNAFSGNLPDGTPFIFFCPGHLLAAGTSDEIDWVGNQQDELGHVNSRAFNNIVGIIGHELGHHVDYSQPETQGLYKEWRQCMADHFDVTAPDGTSSLLANARQSRMREVSADFWGIKTVSEYVDDTLLRDNRLGLKDTASREKTLAVLRGAFGSFCETDPEYGAVFDPHPPGRFRLSSMLKAEVAMASSYFDCECEGYPGTQFQKRPACTLEGTYEMAPIESQCAAEPAGE